MEGKTIVQKLGGGLVGAALSVALTTCAAPAQKFDPVAIFTPGAAPRSATADSYSSFLVARYASLANDPDVAARGYAFAAETSPEDADILERAVFSSLIAGDAARAKRLVEAAPAAAVQQSALARLALGVEHLHAGRAREAKAILSQGGFNGFNGLVARGAAAWAALDVEGLDAAEGVLLSGASGDPLLDGLTTFNAGLLQLAVGQDEAALRTFEANWSQGAPLAVAADAYARLLAASGRRNEAIDVLTTFRLQAGPNAAVDTLRRDLEAGLPVEIVRPTPREGAALAIYTPAAALSAQTSGDLAGVYFALALRLDPELHAARALWADALDDSGRRRAAIDQLDQVPQTSPFYATAQGQIAWALRREGRNEEALATAIGALGGAPDRDLQIQLGDLYRSLDRYADAERVFSTVIDTDGASGRRDWRILFARGASRERQGDWKGAEADLTAALALQPDQPEVLNYLGYSWVDRGQNIEQAFKLIRRAAELRPDAGHIADSLGWAYFRLGRFDDAARHLERAVELSPADPVINDHLGDAYWRVGRRLEASFQWKRALTLDPVAADIARIQQKLAQGLYVEPTRAVALEANAASRP